MFNARCLPEVILNDIYNRFGKEFRAGSVAKEGGEVKIIVGDQIQHFLTLNFSVHASGNCSEVLNVERMFMKKVGISAVTTVEGAHPCVMEVGSLKSATLDTITSYDYLISKNCKVGALIVDDGPVKNAELIEKLVQVVDRGEFSVFVYNPANLSISTYEVDVAAYNQAKQDKQAPKEPEAQTISFAAEVTFETELTESINKILKSDTIYVPGLFKKAIHISTVQKMDIIYRIIKNFEKERNCTVKSCKDGTGKNVFFSFQNFTNRDLLNVFSNK